ncbi:MAG: DEAD/DEAH box helicase [Planctomycetia bacterium]|nr:DEAD/DEAH box helicase [Planctomycetia bacterium]
MMGALDLAGYSQPTPVQAGLIPRALDGADVMAQARTGTGKTAAFAIPILERLEHKHTVQALVLVPTRELAVQVREEIAKLAHGSRFRIVAVYGGKPIRGQIEKLQRGAEVVVGTPGRILDHMQRGTLNFTSLRFAVLDEADRMLDIGFRPDIERILRKCPSSRQTLLLSATVPPPVARLAQRYMRDPEMIDLSPTDITVETIDQYYFTVDPKRKFELLVALLARDNPHQAIIFCRTKRATDRIYHNLRKHIQNVDCIHGDLAQKARDHVMERFRGGKTKVLVATDVVGRGIDVTSISHIINYDIPEFCDDYVHRVGRTGRMGRQGVAYTFVTPEEGNELTRIEMRIDRLLERQEMPGFHDIAKPQATLDATALAQGPDIYGPWEESELPPGATLGTESWTKPAAPGTAPAGPKRKKYRRAL